MFGSKLQHKAKGELEANQDLKLLMQLTFNLKRNENKIKKQPEDWR